MVFSPVAAVDPGNVPGVVGDTGTSCGAGKTSELLGFGFGTGAAAVGGGICAAAAAADRSRTVSASQSKRIAFIEVSLAPGAASIP